MREHRAAGRRKGRIAAGLLAGLLLLASCAPEPEIPTLMVLPTLAHTAVPTAAAPTITPLVLTRPPILPTATHFTSTPRPTATPTTPPIVIRYVNVSVPVVVARYHDACIPATTGVRVFLTSVSPIKTVSLKWNYQGRLDSVPGIPLRQESYTEFAGDMGPFPRPGTVVYWATAEDYAGNLATSPVYEIIVADCSASPPPPTPLPGIFPTITPTYGEALSVHAANQVIEALADAPTSIVLSWEGGVPPYTVDRVMQPEHGRLTGAGVAWVYTPSAGFTGADSFTFRVLDGNNQASTGTITLNVSFDISPPE